MIIEIISVKAHHHSAFNLFARVNLITILLASSNSSETSR